MTANATLFFTPSMAVWPDSAADPSYSKFADRVTYEGHWQHSIRKVDAVTLTVGGTPYSLPIPSSPTPWTVYIIGCQGSALMSTTGKDTDNTTTITGYLPMYGNSVNPTYNGYVVLSTYNLTAASISAQGVTGATAALQIFQILAVPDGT